MKHWLWLPLILCSFSFASAETLLLRFKDPDTKSTFQMKTLKDAKRVVLAGKVLIVEGDYNTLKKNPEILYVERNQTYQALGFPDRSKQVAATPWGLDTTQVAKLWAKGFKGAGHKIAVIDTGVDGEHPEIKGRVLGGYNAITGTTDAMDDHGHGTHCSGTIAGKDVGMAPEAQIIPVKFLNKNGGGTLEDAVKAIDWATQNGATILSNSWGGGGYSQALFDVIQAASDKGIWFIAAAGNSRGNNDSRATYPASYKIKNVIAVAATDKDDKIANFSNYGQTSVLLAAPGVQIYSSTPGGKYDSWSGTSMAAPHVSGALALLLQQGCKDAEECLGRSVKVVEGLKDKTKTSGRLDLSDKVTEKKRRK